MGNEPTPEELELSNWVDGEPRTFKEILADPTCAVLSVAETARLLGVSQCTVYAYRARGYIFAPDTFGGRVLVTKASVQRFLTEGPARPTPEPISPQPCVPPPPASRKRKGQDDGFNLNALRRRTG